MNYIKYLLFGLIIIFIGETIAQENAIPIKKDNDKDLEVFTIVDEMPSFIGGEEALNKYIEDNLIYPERAIENRIEGEVIVSFEVQKDGSLTNFLVLKETGFGCGEEALRLISEMPKWLPGKQRGQAVIVKYILPINFKLDKNTNRNEIRKLKKSETKPVLLDYEYAKLGIGFTVGWGNTYGNFGAEVNYRLTNFFEVNTGLGIGFSGLNMGVGSRIYIPKVNFSPFLGMNLIYAYRADESRQTTNGETCIYRRNSNQALFINGGVKFPVFYNQWLFITGGYAWPFNENEINFIGGVDNNRHRRFMEITGFGGIQACFTLIYYLK